METSTKSFTDKVIDGLKKAVIELEEFRLQVALGKAEASDKYEDAKKKLDKMIRDLKEKLNKGNEKVDALKVKLEALQVQLALGKVETKEMFEEQKKNILKAIHEIESQLKNYTDIKFYSEFSNEVEKFKIKLEILQLRFSLGKLDVKEEFEKRKGDFMTKIENIKQHFSKKEPDLKEEIKENWTHFSNEINEAYSHLKKAFTKS